MMETGLVRLTLRWWRQVESLQGKQVLGFGSLQWWWRQVKSLQGEQWWWWAAEEQRQRDGEDEVLARINSLSVLFGLGLYVARLKKFRVGWSTRSGPFHT